MPSTDTILARLAEQPGATAQELGTNVPTMNELFAKGQVVRIGNRQTGKRGRPPVEWALPGASVESVAMAGAEDAKKLIEASRTWEALSRRIQRAHDEHGYGSPEHREAQAFRRDTFPVPPSVPGKNDYVLAGFAEDDDDDVIAEMRVRDIVGAPVPV